MRVATRQVKRWLLARSAGELELAGLHGDTFVSRLIRSRVPGLVSPLTFSGLEILDEVRLLVRPRVRTRL